MSISKITCALAIMLITINTYAFSNTIETVFDIDINSCTFFTGTEEARLTNIFGLERMAKAKEILFNCTFLGNGVGRSGHKILQEARDYWIINPPLGVSREDVIIVFGMPDRTIENKKKVTDLYKLCPGIELWFTYKEGLIEKVFTP